MEEYNLRVEKLKELIDDADYRAISGRENLPDCLFFVYITI